jgi:FixJ family two-component response regulator
MTDHPQSFLIAVVDDDPRSLESIESLLESSGYAVRLFGSAAALFDSGELAKIDCLISDIGMPGMSGFELLRAAIVTRPRLPVILITGRIELINQSAANPGHSAIFQKPFDGHELLATVHRVTQRQSHIE